MYTGADTAAVGLQLARVCMPATDFALLNLAEVRTAMRTQNTRAATASSQPAVCSRVIIYIAQRALTRSSIFRAVDAPDDAPCVGGTNAAVRLMRVLSQSRESRVLVMLLIHAEHLIRSTDRHTNHPNSSNPAQQSRVLDISLIQYPWRLSACQAKFCEPRSGTLV
ncbi:hypothetical protein IE81DRAFT_254757 [Ceraceosorus guamensis]|uniref:Uncharacterized protein n=1 Tax=Ceraceosorus guamensis TaxID=1522189 RepID=A0A316W4U5_9BASI|nr:hypothetical protein IE81DRAFT_254757 [Ceraceosorus guamensis]PWN44789.1 hypothetical protein IE81DRAFT_254757 [Ceraceosorus guamensis]